MNNLFVTGGSGLLGSNIIFNACKKFNVHGTYYKNKVIFDDCLLYKIDLSDEKQVKLVEKIKPDCIIHCAALTNIDLCEKNINYANRHNVKATKNIIRVAENIGCYLIYISTDSVFDGEKGNYSEVDITNPINNYGKTKLKGEKIVNNSSLESCIIRTNIYGWNKINKYSLAEWMFNKLNNNETLTGFYDVIFTPILVNNLIDIIFEIMDKKITGIINVTGSESCSKLDFSKKIAEIFYLDKNLIKPVSIDEMNLQAKRGKNLSLNISKAQKKFKTKLLSVDEGLMEMKKLRDIEYVKRLKS